MTAVAVVGGVCAPAQAAPPLDLHGADKAAAAMDRAGGGQDRVPSTTRGKKGQYITQHAGGSAVSIPSSTSSPVTVSLAGAADGVAIEVGLPGTSARPGVLTDQGTVVYADPAAAADVGVLATQDGFRALLHIKSADAPEEYRFPVSMPAGGRLVRTAELLGGGSDVEEVLVLDAAGAVVGGFDAPWAKDAKNKPVPTTYRVEGSVLVQHVDLSATSAFPVVADPTWWQITKCVGAISWAIASTAIPIAKILQLKRFINAVGGIRTAASLLLQATTWAEKRRVIVGAIGYAGAEILGIDAIINNC